MTLKEKLQQLREQAGLSQSELAEAIGLKRYVIADAETRKPPKIETLDRLCQFYDITPEDMLSGVTSFSYERAESAEDKVRKLEDKVNELEKIMKGKR